MTQTRIDIYEAIQATESPRSLQATGGSSPIIDDEDFIVETQKRLGDVAYCISRRSQSYEGQIRQNLQELLHELAVVLSVWVTRRASIDYRTLWELVTKERERQQHVYGSNRALPHKRYLRIITEELGEVAKCLDDQGMGNLQKEHRNEELIQTIACVVCWLEMD